MRVLIVKISALGDIVHALPVLAYLHSVDPKMEIDWLLESSFAPLLEGHTNLQYVHRVDTKLWRRPTRMLHAPEEILGMVSTLRRRQYDVCLDLQGNSKSGLFTVLSGAPLRYGFDGRSVREWPNLLATNRRVTIGDAHHHISDRAMRIVQAAFPGGSRQIQSGSLQVHPATLAATAQRLTNLRLADRKLVLLHPGTTWKTKRLSTEFWIKLTRGLLKNDETHVLLSWGNDSERVELQSIRNCSARQITIWPKSSLREFMAILARVDLVIGGDTGPVHIAAAVGTPTISCYRATDRLRNGPRGVRHALFQSSMPCSPCLRKDCPDNEECSDSIHAPEVLQAANRLLAKAPGGPPAREATEAGSRVAAGV